MTGIRLTYEYRSSFRDSLIRTARGARNATAVKASKSRNEEMREPRVIPLRLRNQVEMLFLQTFVVSTYALRHDLVPHEHGEFEPA